jgi:predicted HTH transcriptional regulator
MLLPTDVGQLPYCGPVLTAEEIEQVLALGHEIRGFELKGPGLSTDKHLFAKVARAALSLGNLRDGGHVIIGIDDTRQGAMQPGLSTEELESWIAFDDVARRLNNYADPSLNFERASAELSNSVMVAVLQVFEFSDLPHICAKDYPGILRNGAVYVRPRKLPETSEVPSSVEMRELLDLATEKALRAFMRTAERAGVTLDGGAMRSSEFSDRQYDAQRAGAWG